MQPPAAEIVNPSVRRGPFRAALFDFDGTLSLIREGWPRVMVGLMVERLRELNLVHEPEDDLWAHLDRLVMARNGEPTVRQMDAFVEEVRRRGGEPAGPWDYLHQYIHRLMDVVRERWRALDAGQARAEDWVVPGAHEILQNLRDRNVPLFVASGTDYDHVSHEAYLLRLTDFFPARINAPRNNDASFRKAAVIAKLLADLNIRGDELLAFGDGMVETAEVKRAGGVAVGVASSEHGSGLGAVHPGKRTTLVGAGADIIIADYHRQDELIDWLFRGSAISKS